MTHKLRGDHCRCSGCGAFFNSTRAFDKHRAGELADRRCLSADDMLAKGMSLSPSGWWVSNSWASPFLHAPSITGAAIGSTPSPGGGYDHDRHGAPISQRPLEVSP
jgi:hypothetical protein